MAKQYSYEACKIYTSGGNPVANTIWKVAIILEHLQLIREDVDPFRKQVCASLLEDDNGSAIYKAKLIQHLIGTISITKPLWKFQIGFNNTFVDQFILSLDDDNPAKKMLLKDTAAIRTSKVHCRAHFNATYLKGITASYQRISYRPETRTDIQGKTKNINIIVQDPHTSLVMDFTYPQEMLSPNYYDATHKEL